jgi:predicted RNA binding protein YcfA (HicA-like mRNA interferase family)
MSDGRLPVATGRDVVGALRRAGFVVDRIVGSHHVMKILGDPSRTVTVPVHSGRDLKPGTLRSDQRLNESECKRDQPQSVGSFPIHHGALQFLIPMPADALPCVLQMMIAGRMRYVEMNGDWPRYRQGRIRSYRLVRDHDPSNLPPDE